ncbi:ribosomal protein S5 domain 2-type protein [Pseudoneurospora amorphoporcata]|uniref:Ribosomal protein S5 domain 2-type protein n=1 Tax=Pseudoneurospora amorphoporcata TaxID=241081 RepID=A0AAN6NPL4_9PEZI|nr:ribosomal protein S5 domain 2-type protein [Pseudoneurospora amorphoporcata]
MSEQLADELEAINSIYGDGTLAPADDSQSPSTYILTLPDEVTTSTLRLQFPPAYPDEPPVVLGTHSSGEHAKRGAAARDLALFRDAVGEVYEPGQVCLFDAIEQVKELIAAVTTAEKEDEKEEEEEEEEEDGENGKRVSSYDAAAASHDAASSETGGDQLGPEPPWTLSLPHIELKSTFIARCAPVSSPAQAALYLQHLLASDKRVRAATHNITAWRIRGPNGTSFQDCDDDGETAAGGRLLHLMQLMDLWDTMVVVTRWYGGQKLGPRRFALINGAARDAFVRAGLVEEENKQEGRKKKGGK